MDESKLKALVEKWRAIVFDAEAHGYDDLSRKQCADELESALVEQPTEAPQQAGELQRHFAGLGAVADIVFGKAKPAETERTQPPSMKEPSGQS